MPKSATFDELLDFANKVREAGGGEVIEKLLPGIPGDAESCLIARNLNFSCNVRGVSNALLAAARRKQGDSSGLHHGRWMMEVSPPSLGVQIAEALDLPYVHSLSLGDLSILLPEEIGQVAADFDYAKELTNWGEHPLGPDEQALVDRMLPYFEQPANG